MIGRLRRQSAPIDELIVIDTQSHDGSPKALREESALVVTIGVREFHHASARNLGASLARGDVLLFLTQDVLPVDDLLVERLVEPLLNGFVASYARHVPKPNASPLEVYARTTNYPPRLNRSEAAVGEPTSIRRVFFSNSCSAIRRDVFEQLGGFPTHTIMNEDMVFAARLRRAGLSVAYVPEAIVLHSHDYTLAQTFKRYFDIGVVFDQAREELAGLDATSEGLKYVRGLFTTLWREHQYSWMAAAAAESAAKWVGTFLGKRHRSLPRPVVKRLSMHRSYWDRNA